MSYPEQKVRAMSTKKQSGLVLFPTPPTPPARNSGRSAPRSSTSTRSSSFGHSSRFSRFICSDTEDSSQWQSPRPSLSPPSSPSVGQSRGQSYHIASTLSVPESPYQPLSRSQKPRACKETSSAPPPIRQRVSSAPCPRVHKVVDSGDSRSQLHSIPEVHRLRPKPSGRLSQWIDVEHGQLDRRKLSMYLGNVLDAEFSMEWFADSAEPLPNGGAIDPAYTEHQNVYPQSPTFSYTSTTPSKQRSSTGCECLPDAIICQCSSSPEFKSFSRFSCHKPRPSVSSTKCMVSVPRARFKTAFMDIGIAESIDITEESSPPGLSHSSTETTSVLDIDESSLPSPPETSGAPTPRHQGRQLVYYALGSSTGSALVDNKSATAHLSERPISFSRPFCRQPIPIRQSSRFATSPLTPSTSSSGSDARQSYKVGRNFLGSVSRTSTFDFDFDLHTSQQFEDEDQPGCRYLGSRCELETPSATEATTRSQPPDSVHAVHQSQYSASSISSFVLDTVGVQSLNTACVVTATPTKPRVVVNQKVTSPQTYRSNSEYWRRIRQERQQMIDTHNSGASSRSSAYRQSKDNTSSKINTRSSSLISNVRDWGSELARSESEASRAVTTDGSPVLANRYA